MCVCARVSKGVHGYAQGCAVWLGVHRCAQVCVKVCGCLRVFAWDEFSEYLLENRVPTSADFNTYPIRIFFLSFFQTKKMNYDVVGWDLLLHQYS